MVKLLGGAVLLALLAGGAYYYYVHDKDSVIKKASEATATVGETLKQGAEALKPRSDSNTGPTPGGVLAEPPNADVEGPPNPSGSLARNNRPAVEAAEVGKTNAEVGKTNSGTASHRAGNQDPAHQEGNANGEIVHVVAQGETLTKIARKYYGNEGLYTLIAKANKLDRPGKLKVGQKLTIPPRPAVAADASAGAGKKAAETAEPLRLEDNTHSEGFRPATLSKTVPHEIK